MKTCSACKESLPSECFHKKSDTADGLHIYCKPCRSSKEAARYQEKKDQRRIEMREYYKANKNKWPAYVTKWNKANRHNMIANTAAYKARKKQATVKNDPAIHYFYYAAGVIGEVYGRKPDVDHIVPLNGRLVCGLHAANNLQLLSHRQNCSKGAKWPV